MSQAYKYFENKRVLILGFGREGRSTYNYIRKYLPNLPLAIADQNHINVDDENTVCICGDDYLAAINDYEIVMKSPGVSVRDVHIDDSVDVTCQMELFLKFAPCKKIGITGTKGKTTTSTLTYMMLKAAEVDTCIIGNIGVPVFEMIDSAEGLVAVIEMSSHQLEFVKTSPDVAIITNLYPEHLDHYHGFEGYVNAKLNIIRNQKAEDIFIANADQDIKEFTDMTIKAKQIGVSVNADEENEFLGKLAKLNSHLKGRHNAQDIFFAAAAASIFGASNAAIEKGVAQFYGIPHRMELVGKFKGIKFYNDCIATIPTAVMLAVDALEDVDTLIIGGMDRGIDYSSFITNLVESRISNIICLPETGYKIGKELEKFNKNKVFYADDMDTAVEISFKKTGEGKSCLLSPAASSYNRYKDFEEKGNHFKELVKQYSLTNV
ncbi:MAG: UDP-N-acetylmuramoyl-L-alanine--D-glutamate ligase [Clostridia bacterium]|nr:UDP-N-acetylmuramoyl-L-alanine--D-glutamate ligase [Clostridia bacterium]